MEENPLINFQVRMSRSEFDTNAAANMRVTSGRNAKFSLEVWPSRDVSINALVLSVELSERRIAQRIAPSLQM